MAGNIKGIIVEIGGDTSGLQKALKDVNSKTASLSKELRGINSLLKLDPKNTELLAQKQTVLNETIEATQNRIIELERIKAKADEKMTRGTKISAENYRALERDIISANNKLIDLKNEASNWTKAGNKLIELGNKFDKVSEKINNLGNKLTKTFTTPIIGGMALAAKEATDFETAFTGVQKTVDGTAEQMNNLKEGIKKMAKEIPSTTTEISAVAEAAGQLGIKTEDILSFTRVMIDLGNSTNLSANEAASALAKFANVTKMSAKDYDKLGATIVALGNNFATTEADIVAMGTRLAATGELTGLSEAQIMGLATAMSSVGIEAEAGGSAMSKLLKKIQVAVETGTQDLDNLEWYLKQSGYSINDLGDAINKGGKTLDSFSKAVGSNSKDLKSWYKRAMESAAGLEEFSDIAGMTADEFKQAFQKDAVKALSAFISGLNDTERNGASAIAILDSMGIKEVRLSNTILSLANSSEVMNNAIDLANKSWKDNNALTVEASKRYKTTQSQLNIAKNKVKDVAVSLGEKLLPSINKILDKTGKWIDKLDKLSDSQKENIIKIGLIVAAAGPLLKVGSSAINIIGNVSKGIGTFSKAISLAHNGIGTATGSAATLAKVLQGLTSPAGLAAVGITTAVGLIIVAMEESEKATKEAFSNMGDAASDFIKGIDTAQSHLDAFNEELFVSAEEQEELKKEMDVVQKGITQICKTASDERRSLNEEEIRKFDEYFQRLRELNQREVEFQKQISIAISQQALSNAQSFEGSLEEYKIQSQEWLKTAEEQKAKTLSLIDKQTIEEVALLNMRFTTEEERQSEAYQQEYQNIMNQKNKKIKEATDEIAKINEVYAKGYSERVKQDGEFLNTIQQYTEKQQKLQESHNKKIEQIKNGELWYVTQKNQAINGENETYAFHRQEIWNQMYKDMSDEQEKELGVWLAMVAQTELYGGKIDEETEKMVDSILDSYDSMPAKTKEAMKNAMQPMLEEMKNKEPSLFAKATNIAEGILNRLKKSFDIHSPSRKTRDIFQNVMKGAELGLEDEENKLNREIDNVSQDMQAKFKSILPNMGSLKQSVIDNTKTVFTTPQITFNVQELDEQRLQQCFNYINKKFGSAY